MKTKVHKNSIDSYHGLDVSEKQGEVIKALMDLGEATDFAIACHLNYTTNRVTGRISELKEKGIVVECGSIPGEFRKLVRVCRLINFNELLF